MTDREALEELLRRFGLTPSGAGKWPTDERTVTLQAKEGGVEGYPDFLAVFQFDPDGKFQELNLWE
jgi:hypothetical protein